MAKKRRYKPDDHKGYLMPEMDEFMDNKIDKQNYFTQDEAAGNGDSRLATLGHNKTKKLRQKNESGITSQDDQVYKMSKHKFTPGKIRASRMGYSQNNFHEFPTQKN